MRLGIGAVTEPRFDYVARCNLVNLLSDEDIGSTSVSDSVGYVARGDLYLDLEQPELGVQQATTSALISVGRILPRNAVTERTWNTILVLLASRTLQRH
ncbi:MAG: hypothetical protein RLZZ450_1056 [Pseudomonadota bacterium]|jgi:hypothetical protein